METTVDVRHGLISLQECRTYFPAAVRPLQGLPWLRRPTFCKGILPSRGSLHLMIRSDQSLSRVRLFATPWIAALEILVSQLLFQIVMSAPWYKKEHERRNRFQFSCSGVSDSLRPHGLKHARPPCPSPTLGSLPKFMSIESVMPSNHLIQPVLLEVWKKVVKFLVPGGRQRSITLQHSSLTTPFFSALNLSLQDYPWRKSLPENSQVKGLWGYFIDFWLLKIEAV